MAGSARTEKVLTAIRRVLDDGEQIVGSGRCWAAARRPRVPLLLLGRHRYDAILTDRRLVLVRHRLRSLRPSDVAHAKRFDALVLDEEHPRPTLLQQRLHTDAGTSLVVEWPYRSRQLGRTLSDTLTRRADGSAA